jgi:hypothetical protein
MASTKNPRAHDWELRRRPASRSKRIRRPKTAANVEPRLSRAGSDETGVAYALMRAGAGLGVTALIWLKLLFAGKFVAASR